MALALPNCDNTDKYKFLHVRTGGSTEGTRDAVANATGGVDPMYATNRVGPSFLYSFGPINRLMPNETYNVTLFFAELYWSSPGERLFNISTNNETRLSNFDIFKAAGAPLVLLSCVSLWIFAGCADDACLS